MSWRGSSQGMAIELSHRVALQNEADAGDFVKALNRLEGVQGVSLERMDSEVQSGPTMRSDRISTAARECLTTIRVVRGPNCSRTI